MIGVMKKRGASRVMVFVVIIAFLIAMIPFSVMGNSIENDPLNKSQFVDITGVTLTIGEINYEIANGEFVGAAPSGVKVDDKVRFNIGWKVLDSKIKNIKENDFFVVKLPQTHFDFQEKSNISISASKTNNPTETIAIGILSLVKNGDTAYLKVVFNENVETAPYLANGYLFAEGNAKNVDSDTDITSIGGIKIPGLALTPPEETPGGNYDWKTPPTLNEFNKTGWIDNDTATATWYIYVNYDGYNEKFKGVGDGNPELENAIITDELPYGVTYSGNLSLKIPYYFPNMNDAGDAKGLSGRTFHTSDNYIATQFTEVNPSDQNMSYDDFYDMVKDAGPYSYGIWQNQRIIINVGDILGSLKLDLTWAELKDKVNNTPLYNQEYQDLKDENGQYIRDHEGNIEKGWVQVDKNDDETKAATLKSYARIYGIDSNEIDNAQYDGKTADAVGFYVSFTTSIAGNDRDITNEAIIWHGTSSKSTVSKEIEFQNMGGGVEYGEEIGIAKDIRIIKYDGTYNTQLEGVKFKLQRETSTGVYEDIPQGENGSGTQTTSSNGACAFTGLAYGNYKVVEVGYLDGYQAGIAFKNGDGTFTISHDTNEEILIEAFNYKNGEQIPDKVLGDEETPKDSGTVLGDEAKTSDMSNITPLLIGMLIVMILLLIVSVQNMNRKE